MTVLSFEQAPPISVPFRFFLTAPAFGALAGLVLAVLGPETLLSRWSPGALAMTHLFAAGFMLQVMCGSLLQFVAVVAGANIWRPRLVANIVHPLITAGALVLAAAFLLGQPCLFLLAAVVLVVGLGFFLAVIAIALVRTPARSASIHVLRAAVLGLLITLALGAMVALALALPGHVGIGGPLLPWIDVHAAWGLGGWALMLVVGVSYMVVPMFQLTPAYPVWLDPRAARGIARRAVRCARCSSFPTPSGSSAWLPWAAQAGVLVAAGYAATTLWLQAKRRRRQVDATFVFWRAAMLSLLALALSSVAFLALPEWGASARAPVWLGVLAMPGLFMSVIIGMLYKIMPFLNWLHLQQQGGTVTSMPNMKQMIPEAAMRGQMRLHFAALALLLAAVPFGFLAVPAGLALIASSLRLLWNLLGAARVYLLCSARLRARPSSPVPQPRRA